MEKSEIDARGVPTDGSILLIGYFEIRDKDGKPVRRYVHGPVTDLIAAQYLFREAEAQMLAHLLSMNVHVPPTAVAAVPPADGKPTL